MAIPFRSSKKQIILLVFAGLSFAAHSQIQLAFQGGETGDNWGYTSTLASTIAQNEALLAPNKVTGTTSIVVGGNTGGGNCFAGGSGNTASTPRTFTFNSFDISQSNDFTRTLVFNWGNRFPMCNGTGWDANENLVFTAYHDGVAQAPVTLATGNNNAQFSILTNQYTWSIPPCVNNFYFEVSISTNRADELLFLDDVELTTPQMNTSSAQPSAITGPVTFCTLGGTGTYSVINAAGATYIWSGLPAGAQFTSANGTSSIDVDWGTAVSGTYTLSVTASNACGAVSTPQTVDVTIEDIPVPAIISGPTTFCPGQTIVLSSNYATGNTWSTTATTQNINVSVAGTYTLTVQTACTTLNYSYTVIEDAAPSASITPDGPTTFCAGDSVTLTSSSVTGNLWSTGETTQAIVVSTSGTYTLDVTSTCGTASFSEPVTVNVPPVAVIDTVGSTVLCPGMTVLLIGSGGTSYLWSDGSTNDSLIISVAGTYSVTVTDQCGSGVSTSVTVTSVALPTAQITGTSFFCPGDSTLLTASGGTSYVWSTGEATPSIYATLPGSYSMTSTNECGSLSSDVFVVSLLPLPDAQVSGNPSFCAGDSTLLTATGGTAYLWSTGETTPSIFATAGGNYTVTAFNQCGSSVSAPLNVTVLPLPAPQITGNTSFCTGDSVLLTATGGTTYLWSTGETTASIYGHFAGDYTVAAITSCGQAVSNPFSITELLLPDAQISGLQAFCPGQSVTLTASGGTVYQWSTGSASQSITVGATGSYQVVVFNSCGSGNASIIVTETPAVAGMSANTVSGNAPLTVQFTDESSPGTVSYNWDFEDGSSSTESDPSHIFTQQGIYTVTLTVTNAPGCTDDATIVVAVLAEPSSITIPNVFTPNADGQNDLFMITLDRIDTYHLQLFNRWGNLVIETDDPKYAWDGTNNGEPANDGTYYYHLEATGLDGIHYDKSGFFELIR